MKRLRVGPRIWIPLWIWIRGRTYPLATANEMSTTSIQIVMCVSMLVVLCVAVYASSKSFPADSLGHLIPEEAPKGISLLTVCECPLSFDRDVCVMRSHLVEIVLAGILVPLLGFQYWWSLLSYIGSLLQDLFARYLSMRWRLWFLDIGRSDFVLQILILIHLTRGYEIHRALNYPNWLPLGICLGLLCWYLLQRKMRLSVFIILSVFFKYTRSEYAEACNMLKQGFVLNPARTHYQYNRCCLELQNNRQTVWTFLSHFVIIFPWVFLAFMFYVLIKHISRLYGLELNCDKEYSRSKAERRGARKARSDMRHRAEAIEVRVDNNRARRERNFNALSKWQEKLTALQDAQDTLHCELAAIFEREPERFASLKPLCTKIGRLTKKINVCSKNIAKISDILRECNNNLDHAALESLHLHSDPNTLLSALKSVTANIKWKGDKVRLVAGVYSEVTRALECKTVMQYVNLCVSVISRFCPDSILECNLSETIATLQRHFSFKRSKSSNANGDSSVSLEPMETHGLGDLASFVNKPVTKISQKVIGLVVVLLLGGGLINRENFPKILEFGLSIPNKINETEVISYCYKAVSFVSSSLPFYNGKLDLGELFKGTTTQQIVAREMSIISYNVDVLKSGDPLKFHPHLRTTPLVPIGILFTRTRALHEKLLSELKFKSGSEAISMRNAACKVYNWLQYIDEEMGKRTTVAQAFCCGFLGSPGVGKNFLSESVMDLVLVNNDLPLDDTVPINMSDKYDYGSHVGIILDEYHQVQPDLRKDRNETNEFMKRVSNTLSIAVSADLPSKGRSILNCIMCCVMSNLTEWDPEKDIIEPAAFLRRINLTFSDIRPKPEYCVEGSVQADSEKIKDATDVWTFRLHTYKLVRRSSTSSGVTAVAHYYKSDFTTTVNVREAHRFTLKTCSKFIIDKSRQHYSSQDDLLKKKSSGRTTWCEHEMPDGTIEKHQVGSCPYCNAMETDNTLGGVPPSPLMVFANGVLAAEGVEPMETHGMPVLNFITYLTSFIWYGDFVTKLKSYLPPSVKWWLYHTLWSSVLALLGFGLYKLSLYLGTFRSRFLTKCSTLAGDLVGVCVADTLEAAKLRITEFIQRRGVIILVFFALVSCVGIYKFTTHGNLQFGNKPDTWTAEDIPYQYVLNDRKTTSYVDAMNMIKENILHVKYSNLTSTDAGNLVPYRGHMYIGNWHYWQSTVRKLTLTRHNIEAPQSRYTQDMNLNFVERIAGTDAVVLFLPKVMRCSDFSGFYTDKMPRSAVKCNLLYKNRSGQIVDSGVIDAVPSPSQADNQILDESFIYKANVAKGMCGSCLLSVSKRPTILGIHWAGSKPGLSEQGAAAFLNKTYIESAIKRIVHRTGIQEGAAPTEMSVQSLNTVPIDGKKSFSFLGTEGSLTYAGMSTAPFVKPNSDVVPTIFHDELQKVTGLEPRGPCIGEPWRPAFTAQQVMSENYKINIPYHYLNFAKEDYLARILHDKDVMDDVKTLRPLTLQEVFDGTGRPGEEPMKLNTSIGLSYLGTSGKKSKYFIRDESGVTSIPDEFPTVLKSLEDHYAAGYTSGMPFKHCCKDEVLFKDKARMFSSNSVEHLALMRRFFLPLCGLWRRHNTIFENVIGANVYGPDWDALIKSATKFGKDRLAFGDYKHYDQSLTPEEILIAMYVMIHMAELSGNYTECDLKIMWGVAHDLANPLYWSNAFFFFACGTSPSGHPLTTVLNCIVNSLRHRAVYYANNRALAIPDRSLVTCDLFSENVSLYCLGDDCICSSSEDVIFGMKTLSQTLFEWGITYTDAAKTGVIDREHGSLDELSFLKRTARKIPDIEQWVAPLDKSSILKPLMMNIPSNFLTPMQQLAESVDGSLREAFFHGPEYYDEMRDLLRNLSEKFELVPLIRTECFIPYETRVLKWRETHFAEDSPEL